MTVGRFNDTLCHGSAARLNEGERRILCFRAIPALPRKLLPACANRPPSSCKPLSSVSPARRGSAAASPNACIRCGAAGYLPKERSTNRWGYLPSAELMARLTPRQRSILTERDYTPTENSHVPPGRGEEGTEAALAACAASAAAARL